MECYSNCPMLVVYDYPGRKKTYSDSCKILLEDKKITITFEENGEIKEWAGFDRGIGHYSISDTKFQATTWGTLHRTPGSSILRGRWSVFGETGFWEIKLGETDQKYS